MIAISCSYYITQLRASCIQDDFSFTCPENGYITGLASEYIHPDDRHWQPYCCKNRHFFLTNCQTMSVNWFTGDLNYTAPAAGYVTGADLGGVRWVRTNPPFR